MGESTLENIRLGVMKSNPAIMVGGKISKDGLTLDNVAVIEFGLIEDPKTGQPKIRCGIKPLGFPVYAKEYLMKLDVNDVLFYEETLMHPPSDEIIGLIKKELYREYTGLKI